jgi:hypothetical protein
MNGLQQGALYQLKKAQAIGQLPGYLTEQGSTPEQAYSECMGQAAGLTNQYNNQFPVANLWNIRYLNGMNKLNRLAPKGQNVPSEIVSLVN